MTGSSPRIYKRPLAHTEHPDEYCIGGLAPVYLGDVLAGRYKIFRKLGHGSQSTVWLARDLRCSKCVAVKVPTAVDCHVLEPSHHPNTSSLLDRFVLESPNGKHECIVLEPLGRTLRAVIDQSLEIKFGSDDSGEYYARYNPHHWTIALARDFCRQVIIALDSLHSQGTAHRDVQPGNIAMALSYDIDSRSMDEIQQEGAWYSDLVPSDETDDWDAKNLKALGEDIAWVQRLDEKPLDPTEIQYTVRASPLHDEIVFDDSQPFRAVLFDFGFSRRFEDCDHPLTQVDNYRPPEAILPTTVT
ncbi:Protein kinase dsk1 [Elsinoe australis]|uniref:non-specific serine/threonine protein kinase n=1 Tax=Elsinoe australis TaxID=40998 RepID=A0A2P7Z7K7_9PEZI|nr:Protein kinase dsk1 [Elsinoe australis]